MQQVANTIVFKDGMTRLGKILWDVGFTRGGTIKNLKKTKKEHILIEEYDVREKDVSFLTENS